jgi:hypothetical protein
MKGSALVLVVALTLLLGSGSATLGCSGEWEPNNTIPEADLLGTVPDEACGKGTVDPAGDLDVWYFELLQPGSVTVETSGLYDGDTIIGLYQADGTPIASDDDSGEDFFSRIDLVSSGRTLQPGYYLVAVRDVYDDFSSKTPYIVTVTAVAKEPDQSPPPATDVPLLPLIGVSIGGSLGYTGRGYIDFIVSSDPAWCPFIYGGTTFSVTGQQDIPMPSPREKRTVWRRIEGVLSTDHTMLISLTAAFGQIYENEDTREVSTQEIALRNVPLTLSSPGLGVELDQAGLQSHLVSYSREYYDEMRPWITMSETEKDIDFSSEWTHLKIYFSVEP